MDCVTFAHLQRLYSESVRMVREALFLDGFDLNPAGAYAGVLALERQARAGYPEFY